MAIYTKVGFGTSDLIGFAGSTSTVGSTIHLDPNWSASTDGYNFSVDDADLLLLIETSDTLFGGDRNNDEVGDDGYKQTLTLRDPSGNVVASGRSYLEDVYVFRAPDGSEVRLYTVEVGGVWVGTLADKQMTKAFFQVQWHLTHLHRLSVRRLRKRCLEITSLRVHICVGNVCVICWYYIAIKQNR